jgi:CRP/FNR family transcriptional regulator, cyclic AMP receptor protein
VPNVDLLGKSLLFQNFTTEEIASLASMAVEKRVKAEAYVFTEGAIASSMFVIQSGSIDILKEGPSGTALIIAQLEEGSHFGEMSFVDQSPRAAGAIAREDSLLLEIHFDDLERIVATQPGVGLKLYHSIARTLCERIRRTTSELSHLLLS